MVVASSASQSSRDVSTRALQERAHTVLPGVYAWVISVALPVASRGTPFLTRLSAGATLLCLLSAALLGGARTVLGRCLGVYGFLGCSLLTWYLLGTELSPTHLDPVLAALGALGFMLYALGWGVQRRRSAVPEDAPNVIAGAPLEARAKLPLAASLIAGLSVVGALGALLSAYRIHEPERALFGHSAAALVAIALIGQGARVALETGQKTRVSAAVGERLNAALVPMSILALVFGLGFLWLVVR